MNKKRKKNRWGDPVPITMPTTSSTTFNMTNLTKDTSSSSSDGLVKKSKGGILESAENELYSKSDIEMRAKRANRFNTIVSLPTTTNNTILNSKKSKKKENNNFNKYSHITSSSSSNNVNDNDNAEFDMESLKIVGTCQVVEKNYLRLTSAPNPNTVRPENILKIALTNLKEKWRNKSIEYINLCSQLKAIRQDLTVQHIQNGKYY